MSQERNAILAEQTRRRRQVEILRRQIFEMDRAVKVHVEVIEALESILDSFPTAQVKTETVEKTTTAKPAEHQPIAPTASVKPGSAADDVLKALQSGPLNHPGIRDKLGIPHDDKTLVNRYRTATFGLWRRSMVERLDDGRYRLKQPGAATAQTVSDESNE